MRSTVTDTLPAGLTLAATTAGCTPGLGSGGTITCTLGTVARSHGSDQPRRHVGAAAPNTAPTNTATVSSTTVDPDPTDNRPARRSAWGKSPISRSPRPRTRRRPTSATTSPLLPGHKWQLRRREHGGRTGLGTSGAVVTDVLPPGIQFVSAPGNCTFAAATDTVTCDLRAGFRSQIVTGSFVGKVVDAARHDDCGQRDREHRHRRLGGRRGVPGRSRISTRRITTTPRR